MREESQMHLSNFVKTQAQDIYSRHHKSAKHNNAAPYLMAAAFEAELGH